MDKLARNPTPVLRVSFGEEGEEGANNRRELDTHSPLPHDVQKHIKIDYFKVSIWPVVFLQF